MKNKKRARNKKHERGKALFIIANMLVSIIAFSFMISLASGGVSGADPTIGWLSGGGGAWHILQGLVWAGIVAGAVQIGGRMFGADPNAINAWSAALGAGVFAGKTTFGITQMAGGSTAWQWGLGLTLGIIVAIVVLELMSKKESKKVVTFECYPWEAPSGGTNCEKCHERFEGVPGACSEYRCKSLGQACQLLNAGTGQEKCVWVNPKDVKSPTIEPWKQVLTDGYEYKPDNAFRPPDRGVKILRKGVADGCVKAFTPLQFGITVNEPAQCRIDYNRTGGFNNMAYFFGNSNLFAYNHTQTLSLPSPSHIEKNAPELKNDGKYNLYVKCKDANGNANDDLFVFTFCVEKGPDVTPPRIESTSIANNMPVQFGRNETDLEVYVNEPADCKWSRLDMSYDNMETKMSCSSNIWEMNNQMLYKCKTKLTGLKDRQDNNFYFKCKDQPWLVNSSDRNTNQESYKFTIKGSQPIIITEVKPNGTIKGDTSGLGTLFLELKTEFGSNNGDAWCSFSLTQLEKDYIRFAETGTNIHKQRLDLPSGLYTYYFQCVDLGGNAVRNQTTFIIEIDRQAPIVNRVYQSEGKLKIITDEKSTCSYQNNDAKACAFAINEGTAMPYANSTEHFAEWNIGKNYYIKCQDLNGNQPYPADCSIIVRPRQ